MMTALIIILSLMAYLGIAIGLGKIMKRARLKLEQEQPLAPEVEASRIYSTTITTAHGAFRIGDSNARFQL